ERLAFYLEYSDRAALRDPAVQPCPTCLDTTERVNLVTNTTSLLAAQQLDRKSAVLTFTTAVTDHTGGFIDDPSNVALTLVGSSAGPRADLMQVINHATDLVKTDVLENPGTASYSRYNLFVTMAGDPNVDDDPSVVAPDEDPVNLANAVAALSALKTQ